MALPPYLTILKLVQEFGRMPRGLLYDKLPASDPAEIDKVIEELERKRAIKVEGKHVLIAEESR